MTGKHGDVVFVGWTFPFKKMLKIHHQWICIFVLYFHSELFIMHCNLEIICSLAVTEFLHRLLVECTAGLTLLWWCLCCVFGAVSGLLRAGRVANE